MKSTNGQNINNNPSISEASRTPGIGLGLKLTILILVAFSFLSIITIWFSVNQLRSSLSLGMEQTADGLGKVVGLASGYQGFFEKDNRRLNQYIDEAAGLKDVEYAAIIRYGKVVSSRGLNRDELVSLEERDKKRLQQQKKKEKVPSYSTDNIYEAWHDIDLGAPVGKIGTIVIGISKARINAEEQTIIETQIKVAGLISIFTLFILWLLVFSITRPLRALTEQTRLIGEGNLAEPIISQGTDEVGILASSIEFMRSSLYRNIEKLGFIANISHSLNESKDIYGVAEVLRKNLSNYPLWSWNVAGLALVGRDIPLDSFHYIPVYPKPAEPTGSVFALSGAIKDCLDNKSTHVRGPGGRNSDNPFGKWLINEKITSDLAVPLSSRGQILGALFLGFRQEDTAFNHELQDTIRAIGDDLAAAIDNIYLVSDLKFNLQQLQIAHRELKSLDNVKTEFISGVSHELRTPLVAVFGYVNMMLDEKLGPLTDMQKEGLDVSSKSLQRLTVLIDKILSFSSQLAPEDLRLAPKNIADIIDHCYKMEERRAKNKKITIQVSVEPDLPPVIIDEDLIIQVFINLIDNALKFSEENTVIDIKARKPFTDTPDRENRIEVLIRDRGKGIPEKDLNFIFNKFYQAPRGTDSHRYTGIGLGLSLTKKILDQHNCTISVTSKLGQGTTFVFTLPTISDSDQDQDINPEPAE